MIAVEVFNALDVEWYDVEYCYLPRLQNEASPQADYPVHAGVPRTLRVKLQYRP